ncbi:MAG TPA: glycine cleavage system aminomethyltransferase GcvT [Tepidisphaeraceae bacterium]|jgi:aminomethyltransferase|nr:glycine cleavage system aminomethyltransferase GcvT [Tepidisphaeraceae bacterium]
MLKRTPFYDFHVSKNAKLVDFAGWEMPILYRSIVDEHEQTRKSGGIFDVSHMGRLAFSGKDAVRFLDHVLTRNCAAMTVGQSRYSLVCNEAGGVLDDVIVSRDKKNWIMVVNSSNREKLVRHFQSVRKAGDFDVDMVDNTDSTAMVALQGPKVIDRMGEFLPTVKDLKRYGFESGTLMMLIKYTVFRSGYTGEDGIELIIPAKLAPMAIKMLGGKEDKEGATLRPAGLGARDTLRLEAGMPLYGHELNETIDPISASLSWAVDLNKEFIGAAALRQIATDGPKRKLVGLELEGRRIARQDAPVLSADGQTIGIVTSGTFGPTVQKSIAMAYVDTAHTPEGTQLAVDLKGTTNAATVVKLPFYKRA